LAGGSNQADNGSGMMYRLLSLALLVGIILVACGTSTASAPTAAPAAPAASPVCSCSLSSGEQVVQASDGTGASVTSHAGTCTTPCKPDLKSLLSIKSIDPNAAP